MRIRENYSHTFFACSLGYVTQAVVNNFTPLLFLVFRDTFGLTLSQLGLIVTVNFCVQITVDFFSSVFVDKLGYRRSILIAHLFDVIGMGLLSVLPRVMSEPFAGLLIAVTVNAIGGGMIEVLISPVVEACPRQNKQASMSLLHSFYCWGHVLLVVVSTLLFRIFGIDRWYIPAMLWGILPLLNFFYFCLVPIPVPVKEGEGKRFGELLRDKSFLLFFMIMICAGSTEQAMSQWSSAFAEDALGVSKQIGDIAGPAFFACMMGLSRMFYTTVSKKIALQKYMPSLACLGIFSYLLAGLCQVPVVSFIGCGLCGFAAGIMWPGTLSLAAENIRNGGTVMYSLLALAGDVGCALGPFAVGEISDRFGGNLKTGLIFSAVFPALLLLFLLLFFRIGKKGEGAPEER